MNPEYYPLIHEDMSFIIILSVKVKVEDGSDTIFYLLSQTFDKKSASGITQRETVSGFQAVYLYQISSHLLSLEIDGD